MLFLYCPCFFWPRLGFLVYWLIAPCSGEPFISRIQLPWLVEHGGLDLCSMDHADVCDDLPVERLRLDLARALGSCATL